MRRPSIKIATLSIFGFIAIVYAGLSITAVTGVAGMNDATSELADRWLAGVSAVDDLVAAFKDERLAIAKHMLSRTDDAMAKQEAIVEKSTVDQVTHVAQLRALSLSDGERLALDEFANRTDDYDHAWQKLKALSRQNKNEEALVVYEKELTPLAEQMGEALNRIADANDTGAQQSNLLSDETYSGTLTIVWIAIAIGAMALIAGIVVILRTVISPLGRITGSMKSLADGDTKSDIPFAGRSDEVGAMAAAVEIFRQAAISNKQLQADAEQARHQAELDRVAAQERAEADAAERLRVATSGLATGLQRLASGDLDFQIEQPFAPDFEALRHDFNTSVSKLGETLITVSETISSIENGAREISVGAQDLSKRTEQQAASLEETAAALDEITVNVRNSTQRTDDARKVAGQATSAAAQSTDVVGRAEEAMKRIETSSQQINNIIGVIDEIAFQTNLLALNAGVEAARAGEAGKGFAVVAQEVRELAQRAAAAAKEIKSLIQASSTEVNSGVTLVRDASGALKSIGDFITEINSHMQAIAASAQEQSTGLAEVNTAVNSMDQSTQQNAAMVEQSTAASSSLATETRRLKELVASFRLGRGTSTTVANLRETAALMARPNTVANSAFQPAISRAGVRKSAAALAHGGPAGDWQEF